MGNFFTSTRSKVKELPKTTVKIKANIDCHGCERKVRRSVEKMKGVEKVVISKNSKKVEVVGKVDPNDVLKLVKKTRNGAEFEPQPPKKARVPRIVPYDSTDLEAGSTHSTKGGTGGSPVETITNLFSDENPNACSIM